MALVNFYWIYNFTECQTVLMLLDKIRPSLGVNDLTAISICDAKLMESGLCKQHFDAESVARVHGSAISIDKPKRATFLQHKAQLQKLIEKPRAVLLARYEIIESLMNLIPKLEVFEIDFDRDTRLGVRKHIGKL